MKAPAQLISLTRWQATKCPFSTSSNGGMDWAQASVVAVVMIVVTMIISGVFNALSRKINPMA